MLGLWCHSVKISMPATPGYFAWGCFRYFRFWPLPSRSFFRSAPALLMPAGADLPEAPQYSGGIDGHKGRTAVPTKVLASSTIDRPTSALGCDRSGPAGIRRREFRRTKRLRAGRRPRPAVVIAGLAIGLSAAAEARSAARCWRAPARTPRSTGGWTAPGCPPPMSWYRPASGWTRRSAAR